MNIFWDSGNAFMSTLCKSIHHQSIIPILQVHTINHYKYIFFFNIKLLELIET